MDRSSWLPEAVERLAQIVPAQLSLVRWSEAGEPVVEWVNDAGAALLGLRPDEVRGRPLDEFHLASEVADVVERLREARQAGSVAYEAVRELPGGRRTLRVRTDWLGEDRFATVTLDVTAERDAQRRLAQVTKVTGAGVYQWNVAEDSTSWSPELFELLGVDPEEVTPTPELYLQYVHPDDRADVADNTDAAREDGMAVTYSRHRIVRPDGTERTVDVRAQAGEDGDGQLLYVVGVVRDVTAEEELRRHAELLRRATEQQQTALEVHDGVVQSLATVLLALELEQHDRARTEVMAALENAQELVAELMRQVALVRGVAQPGSLRTASTGEPPAIGDRPSVAPTPHGGGSTS